MEKKKKKLKKISSRQLCIFTKSITGRQAKKRYRYRSLATSDDYISFNALNNTYLERMYRNIQSPHGGNHCSLIEAVSWSVCQVDGLSLPTIESL